ncbi:NEL-type E3 ubiquitin ligase domain-containing protein [Pseudomonas lini]|uniref:NEL-type E3 ubiquitin ligase domain-containing protein n=1 Tax=Pseudomonas lini TaxID=163011 RepID=UPI0027D8866D|nr:NEL-type E3 ubiquitin ligase domain-containing protein [Pseudomonas lini]
MTVETNNTALGSMTPEQQGAFFSLIKQQTPSWLLESPSDVRAALRTSLLASYRTRQAVADALAELKSPESFCTPLLAKAMSDKLGEPLDIEGVVFQHIRSTSSLLGLRKKLITPIDRDLLMAACENFESSETAPGNYDDNSFLYIPECIHGRSAKVLSIEPHEFAKLCRTLDLGKQYQAHLKSMLEGEPLRFKHQAYAKHRFEVDMHIAFIKKHVSADVYNMLKSVKDCAETITLGNNALGYQGLEMLGVKLHGAIFIGPVNKHADRDYRCVVYLPGDPLHPLKEYESFKDFEAELERRLRETDFREFFMRFILLRDRPGFHAALNARQSGAADVLLKFSISVTVDGYDVDDDVFLSLFHQRSAHVIADARLLVVPTDDEDEKTRLARLETYKTIGVNALLFFGSFLPVVGAVMFAVAGGQLLAEVYEGIDSWSRGEQEEATDHLFDVIENLILTTATAAGAMGVGKGYKVVRSSDFISRLRAVSIGSGSVRLWKPDLKAYRQHLLMPDKLPADKLGLVKWRERQYMRTGTDTYALRPIEGTDLWQVEPPEHPQVSVRYSPVMETNGAGAWLHDSELPQQWNLLTLFRRLGYREEDIPDTEGLQILAASGLDESQLRQLYPDRSKPMAMLVDTVRRFRADKAVNRFMEQMRVSTSASQADADLQLYLLTSGGKWPQEKGVSITDITGGEVERYGRAQASRQIRISKDLFNKGQFYSTLLKGLDTAERKHLIGSTTTEGTLQAQLLAKVIAERAEGKRLSLFNRIYQRSNVTTETKAAPVHDKFATLPASVADELVQNTDSTEWLQLDDAKVPLRLAEEARRYAQVVRLNRAYEGLYLDAASGIDTDQLVLNTLMQLPGWPNDVFVEIVEWAVPSEKRASIGPKDAAHKLVIEAHPDRFEASDASGKNLFTHLKRTRAHFFQTLWEGLPVATREALGVETPDAGVQLRKKITALALQQRDAIAGAIGIEPRRTGYRSPMGLADRLIAKAILLGLPPSGEHSSHSPALLQRAQELYPTHSPTQVEHFLTTLGTDEVLAIQALEALRQEHLAIRDALDRWVNRPTHHQEGDGPRLRVPQHSKGRAALAIVRAWRKDGSFMPGTPEMLYKLSLDPQPLGDIPVLVGNFSHIGALELDRVGASAGLNAFLRNFPNLRTLSLTGNELSRIPQAIAAMPKLEHLDLSDNRIHLTPEAIQLLNGLEYLQTLNLSFNPALGQTPTVTTLKQLRHLALRGSGIVDWPVGVNDLSALQTMDLRDNRIAHIPDTVFKARPALNLGTNVDGNPLSASSLKALAAYQRSNPNSLGVIAADYLQVAPVQPDIARHGSIWLSRLVGAELARRQAIWNSLSLYPRSRDFFHLLARLHDTADYDLMQTDLTQRVWNVLEAAAEDDVLRRALFQAARIGRVSAENAAGLFSDMVVRVLCYQAVVSARTGNRTLEGELVHLLRGLFRLQQVERQAMSEIGRRTLSGPFTRAQARELELIYRVSLAQRLDLPAQPREMNFVRNVDVSPEELDSAYREVAKAENSAALLTSIKARRFWYDYLRQTHQDQFNTLSERSAIAFAQLEAQVALPRATATLRQNAIIENYKNDAVQLFDQLTAAALARHPGLPLPAEEVCDE